MSVSGRQEWRRSLRRLSQAAVDRGVPPAVFGYRAVREQTLAQYFARRGQNRGESLELVHPPRGFDNPLPLNLDRAEQLPDDAGWWGYSFRDMPTRCAGATRRAVLRDATVVAARDPHRHDDFYPVVLAADGTALRLRELRWRACHRPAIRRGQARRLDKATWVLERVYDNHSHWLTAHLPKLLWLKQRDVLADVILPRRRTPVIDATLDAIGLDPASLHTADEGVLRVGELTLLETDRFRPELLRLVPPAFGVPAAGTGRRKLFVSRSRAARRRLVNEDELWPRLEPLGFERVWLEDLPFKEQVGLMKEAAVLAGPHGAGLTNMMFCPAGATVVEIADPGFPNPNFYALASALGHRYVLIAAEGLGGGHPLEHDLRVDVNMACDQMKEFSRHS